MQQKWTFIEWITLIFVDYIFITQRGPHCPVSILRWRPRSESFICLFVALLIRPFCWLTKNQPKKEKSKVSFQQQFRSSTHLIAIDFADFYLFSLLISFIFESFVQNCFSSLKYKVNSLIMFIEVASYTLKNAH